MNEKKHTGRAVLGFFTAFFLVITLILSGILAPVRYTVLNGSDLTEILENSGFYETVQSAAEAEIYDRLDQYGIDEDVVDGLIPDTLMQDLAVEMSECLESGEDVDLSDYKDDCIEYTQQVSQQIVNSVFSTLFTSSQYLDETTLSQNRELTEFAKEYGIDAVSPILDSIEEEYGTRVLDLSKIDRTLAKEAVSSALSRTVYSAVGTAFDTYIERVNEIANRALTAIRSDERVNGALERAKSTVRIFSVATTLSMVVSACLIVLMLVIYARSPYRGFRNLSVSALISGISLFALSKVLVSVKNLAIDKAFSGYSSAAVDVAKDFVNGIATDVLNFMSVFGLAFAGAAVVLFAVSLILKKLA